MRFATILVTVLLTAACGGGAAPAATSAPAGEPAATAAPAGGGAAATAAPAAAAATAAAPAFSAILGAAKTANYKVTYKWTTTVDGKAETAEQSWYQMGAKKRFDFSTAEGSLSFYELADGSYMCTRGAQTTCLGMPAEAGLAANPGAAFQLEVEDRPDQFDPTFEGTRQIAGQSAQCFSLASAAAYGAAGVQSRICYSASGIPLLIQNAITGLELLFEATAFSTNVTDADFTLPATPIKYP